MKVTHIQLIYWHHGPESMLGRVQQRGLRAPPGGPRRRPQRRPGLGVNSCVSSRASKARRPTRRGKLAALSRRSGVCRTHRAALNATRVRLALDLPIRTPSNASHRMDVGMVVPQWKTIKAVDPRNVVPFLPPCWRGPSLRLALRRR